MSGHTFTHTIINKHPLEILNERAHIFQKDNDKLDAELTSTSKLLLQNLKNNKNLVYLLKNDVAKYSKISFLPTLEDDVLDSVPLITIYAKKNPELEGIDLYNIFDTNTLGFTKNDVEPTEFPLYDSDHISLICEIEPDFKNNIDAYIEELSAGIKHELMHYVHKVEEDLLHSRAGDAYYWSSEICQVAGDFYPLAPSEISRLSFENISSAKILQIFGTAVYFMDPSEMGAWRTNYEKEYKNALKHFGMMRVSLQFVMKQRTCFKTYQLYNKLNLFFTRYKTVIPLIINSNPKIRKVVSEYLKSIGNKPNMKALLRTWIQKSKQQCDDMEAAYIDSVVNKKF